MAKKDSGTEHFEVSFADAANGRRVALAHSEGQAVDLASGFEAEGLEDVQVHRVTTTREPVTVG